MSVYHPRPVLWFCNLNRNFRRSFFLAACETLLANTVNILLLIVAKIFSWIYTYNPTKASP